MSEPTTTAYAGRIKNFVKSWLPLVLVGFAFYGIWLISQSFLTSITVEIVAEGKPYTIERTIRCVRVVSGRGFGSTTSYFFIPSVASFGVELPSGAAVLVVTPNVCNLYPPVTYGPGGRTTSWRMLFADPEPINPDFVPLMGWIPNAKTQDEIQLFLTRESISGDDKKLQFRSIKVAKASQFRIADSSDNFITFPNSAAYFDTKRVGATFFSYYGVAVSQQEWSQFFELPVEIRNSPTPVVLPPESNISAAALFTKIKESKIDFIAPYDPFLKGSEYFPPGSTLMGSLQGGYVGLPPSIEIDARFAGGKFEQNGRKQDWQWIIPFQVNDRIFTAVNDERGTIRLKRFVSDRPKHKVYSHWIEYSRTPPALQIEETLLTPTFIKGYLYVPSTDEVWFVGGFEASFTFLESSNVKGEP